MKRVGKVLLLLLGIGMVSGCIAVFLATANRGITLPQPVLEPTLAALDVRAEDRAIAAKLRAAPWQGLRYVTEQREWRFYAVAGESRKIDLMLPFDLVKVYFLQADGDLNYTWAATGVDIPGEGYYTSTSSSIQKDDLVEVAVGGEYVSQYGVAWEDCDTEYCHLAQRIDTTLILDDQGTGLTNGFIRHGWLPPTHPMYGFLCWQIRPYTDRQVAQNTGDLH